MGSGSLRDAESARALVPRHRREKYSELEPQKGACDLHAVFPVLSDASFIPMMHRVVCTQGEERQQQVCFVSRMSYRASRSQACSAFAPLCDLAHSHCDCILYQLIGMTSTNAQAALDRAANVVTMRAAHAADVSAQNRSAVISVPNPNSNLTTFDES